MKKLTKVVLTIGACATSAFIGYEIGKRKAAAEYEQKLDELNARVDEIIEKQNSIKNGENAYGAQPEEVTAETTQEEPKAPKESANPVEYMDETYFDDPDDYDPENTESFAIRGAKFVPTDEVDQYTSESGGYNFSVETLFFYPDDPERFNVLVPQWDPEDVWENFDCEAQLGDNIDDIMDRLDNPIPGEPENELYYVNFDSMVVYKVIQKLECSYEDEING